MREHEVRKELVLIVSAAVQARDEGFEGAAAAGGVVGVGEG
jgi:hypothetical protein